MEVIKIIFYAIVSIGFFVGFIWGFYYLMNKFFGVQFTSRTNYHNQVRMNELRHNQTISELNDIDEETINLAKENLSKKLFAHTSDNLIEEVRKIQSKSPSKNDFVPDLTEIDDFEVMGNLVYKNAPYCCYYNGITIYLKFITGTEGIIALSRGEPTPSNITSWFNEGYANVIKFEYKYEAKNCIRFLVFHTGKKYGYDVVSKHPSLLKVARWVPYGQTITHLEFVICK